MIFFIRHGQTDDNLNQIYTGQKDVPLNQNGIAQAKSTAEELKDTKIDICFCSPLLRAKQTCEEIVKYHKNLRVIYDDRLKERDYGNLVGLPVDTINYNRWQVINDKRTQKEYNAETIMSVFERLSSFYDEILPKYKNKNILVVAHSGVGRISSAYFNGMPEDMDFSTIKIKNASMIQFNHKK